MKKLQQADLPAKRKKIRCKIKIIIKNKRSSSYLIRTTPFWNHNSTNKRTIMPFRQTYGSYLQNKKPPNMWWRR